MRIIRKVLNRGLLTFFNKEVLGDTFPWFYINATTSNLKPFKNSYEHIQFFHTFIDSGKCNSPTWLSHLDIVFKEILKPFDIDKEKIERMKINYQPQYHPPKGKIHNNPHVDFDGDFKTVIFYLNTCDGATYFFDKEKISKKIESEANTLIQFDGNLLHAGSHPQQFQQRLVLNINYKCE